MFQSAVKIIQWDNYQLGLTDWIDSLNVEVIETARKISTTSSLG